MKKPVNENAREWYLGLDIGTNSVGSAATDTEYSILTKNGKLQCGTRLFEDAETAGKRRAFRSSRRRRARRKVRINLLQELFSAEMKTKDDGFFKRLNSSSIQDDDGKGLFPLFADKGYTDKQYYAKFPTIYHLRKHLMENEESDIRLLYLACHNLIKYRGHFLSENFNANTTNTNYKLIIDRINVLIGEEIDRDVNFDVSEVSSISTIVNDKSISANEQWAKVGNLLNPSKDKWLNSIFRVIQGRKIQLSKIWPDLLDIEKELKNELKEFKFSSDKYEGCISILEDSLSNAQLSLIDLFKQFYDAICLERIMSDSSTISEAMVKRYNEHKEDLKLLKDFLKTHLPEEFDTMFRTNKNYKEDGFTHASYANYIGSNLTHGKKSRSHSAMCVKKGEEPVTADYDSFLKYTDDILNKAKEKDGYQVIKDKIDNKTLCKIQNLPENSYFPYQLNEVELKAILERQKHNFSFLQDSDKYGTVFEKIISLLTFRIPYYIGPLCEKDSDKFAWIKKNVGFEGVKVTPWNFSEVVDTEASGELFIKRMTSKCTYLKAEDVLPKQSLLYQRYMLLQDLNNIKINGKRICQEWKIFLYDGICQTESSLTKAKIKKALVEGCKILKTYSVGKETENDLAFNSSLSSLINLKKILGECPDEKMCEDIIKWHTIFGREKVPIENKIRNEYGNKLSPEQIKSLTNNLSFSGWARFSEKFLNDITVTDMNTGETALTIIKLLSDTTQNLVEILNSEHYTPKFLDIVANKNICDFDGKVDYSLVSDLYCSSTVKRSIWQAVQISKELAKINGSAPKKVFIEVTRGSDKRKKGKMTVSRRNQIEELLNKTASECLDYNTLINELSGKTDAELRSDKLYLYFTQLGKCMYSGEKIDLVKLNDDNQYDIDHIYPQSKIKDDSLSNRVLVKRKENTDKGDIYPIKSDVQSKMKPYWDMLKSKGLISNEKYNRLICTQPLSDDIINGFINRQLVSTNQAVKETAEALKLLFGENTRIVYSKAGNMSEFRHSYSLVKCREVSNLHHAHDAYLNIVVGNVWDYTLSDKYFWKQTGKNLDNGLDKLFKFDIEGIWKTDYINKIKGYLGFDNNKKYLNRFPVTKCPYEKKGAFYDQTIHPKGKAQFELHEGFDTNKYGGYITGFNAYNCVIAHTDKKGKKVIGIFSVPVRYVGRYTGEDLLNKLAEDNNLKNPILVMPRILMDSILEIDGVRYKMRTGVYNGNVQYSVVTEWYPDKEIIQIVHDIVKYLKLVEDKQLTPDTTSMKDIIFASRERNKAQKENKGIYREKNEEVYDAIMRQLTKPFYTNIVKVEKFDRDSFVALETYKQAKIIIKLLKYVSCGEITIGDLECIGGTATENAKWVCSSNITDRDVSLITQSVTGLFEKKVIINKKEPR